MHREQLQKYHRDYNLRVGITKKQIYKKTDLQNSI